MNGGGSDDLSEDKKGQLGNIFVMCDERGGFFHNRACRTQFDFLGWPDMDTTN